MQTYTVVRGDALYKIADRYGVELRALIAANPQIENPDLIYPGQVISVPTAEDTSYPEARRAGVGKGALAVGTVLALVALWPRKRRNPRRRRR